MTETEKESEKETDVAKNWNETVKKYMSPERLAAAKLEAEAVVLELRLKELRELVGKTQAEVAEDAHMVQAAVSQMEKREDHLLSSLRKYVEALGGELEVVAHIDNKRVTLLGA